MPGSTPRSVLTQVITDHTAVIYDLDKCGTSDAP